VDVEVVDDDEEEEETVGGLEAETDAVGVASRSGGFL
jgi:hypothetical protein